MGKKRVLSIAAWSLMAAALTGCSMYAMTGETMTDFSVEHALPYTMTIDDVGIACASGLGQTTLLESFGRVIDPPSRAAVLTYSSAAMCSEMEAWGADLDRLAAMYAGDTAAAQDARIVEKRAHELTARRNLAAYDNLTAAFGQPGDGCPELDAEMNEPLLYVLGLSAGLLAVVHDRATGGVVGVPMETPPRVARATECLDDARWWGVPRALRAAIWTTIPGASPEGVDPWQELAAAARMGDAAGVSLPRAMWVQAAAASGRREEACAAIAEHARLLGEQPRSETHRLLDAYGTMIIRHEADRSWVEAVGHRTPPGELSCYVAPQPEALDDDTLDLLDGLGEDALEAPPEDAPEAPRDAAPGAPDSPMTDTGAEP